MSTKVVPLCLKDAPALIERLLPVQKLSAESFKERKAATAQALTALGNFWKGRKPLILNRACLLGCLLPATGNDEKDLEVFELLMAMDDRSMAKRLINKNNKDAKQYLDGSGTGIKPAAYRDLVSGASRPDECKDDLLDHVWPTVNKHLGTGAKSIPELVEQLGVMRYGRRPQMADAFCGSGQIPFEAARIGCDVFASDLNPMACMLTWGAFNVIGCSATEHDTFVEARKRATSAIIKEIDALGFESDGNGWYGRGYVYCVEARCPQTGWLVPLIPSLVLSEDYGVIAELVPDKKNKRYDIVLRHGCTVEEMKAADKGSVRTDGRGQDPYMFHVVDGKEYKTKISTLRGDYKKDGGGNSNKLRWWKNEDIYPQKDDVFQERIYAILWVKGNKDGGRDLLEFRSVTEADNNRERAVREYVQRHFSDWQKSGLIPSTRIEPGDESERLYRERGWTHWHHLFTPRQLLTHAIINKHSDARLKFGLFQAINYSSRLCIWLGRKTRGYGNTVQAFNNQTLNTLFNFGGRGTRGLMGFLNDEYANYRLPGKPIVNQIPAAETHEPVDIVITDPPYGDAVKYEEILEFFIGWVKGCPPAEMSSWIWDSRKALAIKGEDEDFRRGMVAAYKKLGERMSPNGIQIVMFTHQSGAIWADMANIVWASGLQVTSAWYVATETDNPMRDGAYVQGTVLLVLRRRSGVHKVSRDDLGYEIQEEVEKQISDLTGLNQAAKGLYRDANVFEDADVQMAGYAAALRVLTRYAVIDGKDMPAEALRPRVKGETTFVDKLINFAVDTANQCLVPEGLIKSVWDALSGPERFYLKLLELEAKGIATLDNYQNFAKAFKVADFQPLMASSKANKGRLRSAKEFKAAEMGEGSQLYQSPLRCMLYAIKELGEEVDGDDVLKHLALNVPSYYDQATRDVMLAVADFLAAKLERLRQDEASSARVLRDLIRNQRIG
jgi:putative DNA methylase